MAPAWETTIKAGEQLKGRSVAARCPAEAPSYRSRMSLIASCCGFALLASETARRVGT